MFSTSFIKYVPTSSIIEYLLFKDSIALLKIASTGLLPSFNAFLAASNADSVMILYLFAVVGLEFASTLEASVKNSICSFSVFFSTSLAAKAIPIAQAV